MSAPVLDKEIADKFRAVTVTNYKDQAIFYLNAFWTEGADAEAESVWQAAHGFAEVDHAKGKNGNELNEVAAHHYLQSIGRTLTAIELRKELRKIDIDANGEMALAEYLLFLNNRDVIKCVTNPQGGEANPQELKDAQARLDALTAAFDQLQVQLEQQKALEAASKKASAEAIKVEAAAVEGEAQAVKEEAQAVKEEAAAVEAENEAKEAEAKVRAAEAEVRAAEAEAVAIDEKLKAEQDAHNNEISRLEALSQDMSVGVVRRNTAVQQLASLKEADPLPLQRAKMSQEAQVRKVQKVRVAAEEQTAIAAGKTAVAVEQRQAAEAARAAAEAARAAAEAARAAAEAARAAAEAAAAAAEEQTKAVEAQIAEVQKQTAEAEEKLAELKSQSGVPHGAIWWMEREITEKKKSLPQRFQ